jgi:hypothetical protein
MCNIDNARTRSKSILAFLLLSCSSLFFSTIDSRLSASANAQEAKFADLLSRLKEPSNFTGTVRTETINSVKDGPTAEITTLAYRDEDGRFCVTSKNSEGHETYTCFNGEYLFTITRAREEPWTLSDVETIGSEKQSIERSVENHHEMHFDALHSIKGFDVVKFIESDSNPSRFVASDGDAGLTLIEGECPDAGDASPCFFGGFTDLWIAFDPRKSDRIVEYRLHGPARELDGQFEYSMNPNDVLTSVETLTDRQVRPTGEVIDVECRWTRTIDEGAERPSGMQFNLSDYDLPEPSAIRAAGSYRTSPWLYYFFGGVLLVAVGAFFVHRATRRSRSA